MKSETDTIIAELLILADAFKGHNHVVVKCLGGAAGRLEELQRANKNTLADLALAIERRDDSYAEIKTVRRELAQAIAERTPHDYGLLKGEVDNLKRELSEAIKERNKTVADLIKQRDEAIASARPEPSRLEIAAMAMQGMLAASSFDTLRLSKSAFEYADTLIAAAKGVAQ